MWKRMAGAAVLAAALMSAGAFVYAEALAPAAGSAVVSENDDSYGCPGWRAARRGDNGWRCPGYYENRQ